MPLSDFPSSQLTQAIRVSYRPQIWGLYDPEGRHDPGIQSPGPSNANEIIASTLLLLKSWD